eukprot:3369362-Lingulodinium_polyedra.AAC.1
MHSRTPALARGPLRPGRARLSQARMPRCLAAAGLVPAKSRRPRLGHARLPPPLAALLCALLGLALHAAGRRLTNRVLGVGHALLSPLRLLAIVLLPVGRRMPIELLDKHVGG